MAGIKGSSLSNRSFGQMLRRSASTAAMAAIFTSGIASAQDDSATDNDDGVDTIVVQGIRKALDDAQDIKRNADVFVDAITASDIGALPDRSVSEALQRVPGVNVLRFAGPEDPDHFAVEGSGVIVRGLPFVRSELNGRDVFGASPSSALGFEDVSPELLGSVQVFKNQSADMVEGGLAGTVDLRTRLPFDSDGRVLAGTLDFTYSDFAEEVTPSFSALVSDRFDTSAGEFGFLLSGSFNSLRSRADAVGLRDFRPFTADADGMGERFDAIGDLDGDGRADTDGIAEEDIFYIPGGGSIRSQEFDRERQAISAAGQWESVDGTVQATLQFLHSDSDLVWGERVVETDAGIVGTQQVGDLVFDDDNILTRGIVRSGPGGSAQIPITRERAENDTTTDLSFNLKWAPTERLRLNFDMQMIDAETEVFDVSVFSAVNGAFGFDSNAEVPAVLYLPPEGQGADFFDNDDMFLFRAKMDHAQDSEAESVAFRGDVEYDFDGDGWLRAARFGARYSDRNTDLRYSTFNWGNVSEVWTSGGPVFATDPALSGSFEDFDFENFQRGVSPLEGVPFFTGPLAQDYDAFVDLVNPILERSGQAQAFPTLGGRAGAIDGTLFLPSEVGSIEQETTALYARADFGQEFDNGWSLDGNVGVRYVDTNNLSRGSFGIQSAEQTLGISSADDQQCDPDLNAAAPPGVCNAPNLEQLIAFFGEGAGSAVPQSFENDYDHWLPSLNMKLDVGGGHLFRFGASRSIVRPDVFDLRASVTIEDRQDIIDTNGVRQFNGIGGETGNPFLNPIEANQFDLSWEWYFAEAGSLTVSGFTKELENFWIGRVGLPGQEGDIVTAGSVEAEITNNGITQGVVFDTRVNAEESGTIRGIELAYQQFYDFLPAPFDGFGTQFNYTYIDASGVEDIDPTATGRFASANDDFERISEHQFNLVGLYEKGKVQARVAFNWRDEFLLTRRDVIDPFNSIYQEATGQMDASLFYDLTDNLKVGVQGVNLLDDITETTQLINDDELRAPRAFNRNDRRFSFVIRANY